MHAWNLDFFKLCVYDNMTLDKGWVDYARVLISTSSLDVIKTSATLLVDGEFFDFQITEEGGFSLGEDGCLSNDEVSHTDDVSNHDVGMEEMANRGDVEQLLNHLSEELNIQNSAGLLRAKMSEVALEILNKFVPMGGRVMTAQQTLPNPSPIFVHVREGNEDSPSVLNLAPDPDGSALKNKVLGDDGEVDVQRFFPSVDKRVVKRSSSSPPGRTHNLRAGPGV